MAQSKGQKRRGTLVYPSHQFKPEEWLDFIEMKPFTTLWGKLRLDDDDLWVVQAAIMADPTGPPVIPKTEGLRKIRFAPLRSDKGKRGGMRVCYVYFEEYKKVALAIVYPKSKKDDLTEAELKVINDGIARIKTELAQ